MRLGNERVDSKLFAIGLVSSRQWTGYQKDGVKVAGMPLALLSARARASGRGIKRME